MARTRNPAVRLFMTGVIAVMLMVPLMMVYWLVYDRESQSQTAQAAITQGWGGPQVATGPVLVIPFEQAVTTTEDVNGQPRTRTTRERRELFVSATRQSITTTVAPDRKRYAIYESVVFDSQFTGSASFAMPTDLPRIGVDPASLRLDQAELRFGVADPRGLRDDARVSVNGAGVMLQPGHGQAITGNAGFSAPVTWDGARGLEVTWAYGLRGSHSLGLVPRGGETEWEVSSTWAHPGFSGSFLPDSKDVSARGFTARYEGVTNLALGQPLVSLEDSTLVQPITVDLVDPVDLYSQVDRAVKYGFLFIAFTFATFLLFDLVGGAPVAAAEYLLTGMGLILFFVLLLALAEVLGFAVAYVLAAGAIIGLLTAYSAAVLGTWRRAGFIGALLAGLYALLYVLLNLETYSLLIGALLLFAALAGVMFATRRIDWSGRGGEEPTPTSA